MERELPRIDQVKVAAPSTLTVRWRGVRDQSTVNLIGWIATGGSLLAPLRDAEVFKKAEVINFGAAIGWDDGGDLAIDALHLKMLASEQRPFSNSDVRRWQGAVKLSNAEAAELLGISASTWNSYKVNAAIPQTVAITLRAAQRDPLLLQAHLRPRTSGRPRKVAN